jgi:hypothetical protein
VVIPGILMPWICQNQSPEAADMIDAYPELDRERKIRIKQESLIPGFKLKIFPDEQENPRKS